VPAALPVAGRKFGGTGRLSNVVRHAGASIVKVVVKVQAGLLTVTVADDGCGIAPDSRRSGLGNLSARAERTGGTSWSSSGKTRIMPFFLPDAGTTPSGPKSQPGRRPSRKPTVTSGPPALPAWPGMQHLYGNAQEAAT
jgi:hypothetical protein